VGKLPVASKTTTSSARAKQQENGPTDRDVLESVSSSWLESSRLKACEEVGLQKSRFHQGNVVEASLPPAARRNKKGEQQCLV
jgi:hypothetical protein